MSEILKHNGNHEPYEGPERRRTDMNVASALGKLTEKMTSIETNQKVRFDSLEQKVDTKMDMMNERIKHVEDKTEERIKDIREDHEQYRAYVRGEVEHHVKTNESEHDDIKGDMAEERYENRKRIGHLETMAVDHEKRIKVLEEKPITLKAQAVDKILKWIFGVLLSTAMVTIVVFLINKALGG
jgi:hypothetical protein